MSRAILFGSLLLALFLAIGCAPGRKTSEAESGGDSGIRFRDVAADAGIAFERSNGAYGRRLMPETMGGGGAFLDYDNDGWLDVLLVNGDWWPGHPLPGARPTLRLYRNRGDGTFEDSTRQAGLAVSIQGMGAAIGDFDGDGFDDIFVTAVGRSRLFRNVPADAPARRAFREATEEAGLADTGWSTAACWLDFDLDGDLDLFVGHYLKWTPVTDKFCGSVEKSYCRPQEYDGESCRLYRNDRGKFADVTKASGIYNPESKALGVCATDVDGDGLPDLIVANDMTPNFLFRNVGKGRFEEIGLQAGIGVAENGRARAGMGIDAADYRGTGTEGVAIGNFCFEGAALYDLVAEGLYPQRSREAGLFDATYPWITFGLFFADFDRDGWPDLFLANGHIEDNIARTNPGQTYEQPSLLFRNRGNGSFAEVGKQAGEDLVRPIVGRGACRGDFDNDGKVDILLIGVTGKPRLLRNESVDRNRWIGLKLAGPRGNRHGFGAKVTVEAGGRTQTRMVRSAGSYLSDHDPRLVFGLGEAARVDRIVVRWPDGKFTRATPEGLDRYLVLRYD